MLLFVIFRLLIGVNWVSDLRILLVGGGGEEARGFGTCFMTKNYMDWKNVMEKKVINSGSGLQMHLYMYDPLALRILCIR